MHIVKVANGIYEVRLRGRSRAFIRGSLKECVDYMNSREFL